MSAFVRKLDLKRAAALVVALAAFEPSIARADQTDICASAAERAQLLTHDHKLRGAASELLVCAQSSCPKSIRDDCVEWQRDLDTRLPTVVFRAFDARGRDVVGVEVEVDGQPAGMLDGTAVPMDPGAHRVRFRAKSGAVHQDVLLVVESQKARLVTGRFEVALNADGTRPQSETVTEAQTRRPIGPVTYVAGGVSLAALGVFTAFEVLGQADHRKLADTCAPTSSCSSDDIEAGRNEFRVAAVGLGVGIAALAVAVYTYLTRPTVVETVTAANLRWHLRGKAGPTSSAIDLSAHF